MSLPGKDHFSQLLYLIKNAGEYTKRASRNVIASMYIFEHILRIVNEFALQTAYMWS